jgi:hypothetical protein
MGLVLFVSGFVIGTPFGIWCTLKTLKRKVDKNAQKFVDGFDKGHRPFGK